MGRKREPPRAWIAPPILRLINARRMGRTHIPEHIYIPETGRYHGRILSDARASIQSAKPIEADRLIYCETCLSDFSMESGAQRMAIKPFEPNMLRSGKLTAMRNFAGSA